MQAFLKVLACAALSGALVLPQQGAALPFGLQARQIQGGANGSFDGSLSIATPALPDLPTDVPSLATPALPDLPTDVPSLATPTLPDLPTDVPSLATPTIPSLPTDVPSLATPTIPSLPTGSDLPDPTAVFSSLSSALNALPTGDVTSQTQAFETFLKNTLGSFEDVIGGNFDGIPDNLGNSGDLNTPDLPEPLSTLYDIFNNGLQTLFSSLNLDIPSPALGVVPTDGDDNDGSAPSTNSNASADLTSAQAGSASADLENANNAKRDLSVDDTTAVAGSAAAGLTNAVARRAGYKFNFDLNSLLKELTSSFNQLIDSYGVDGFETIIPSDVSDAIPSTN